MATQAAELQHYVDYGVKNRGYYSIEAKGPLLDKVYSLRYQSYRSKGFINANKSHLFMDKYDELGNSRSFLTYFGNTLVGSLRCSLYTPDEALPVPVMEIFDEEIRTHVGVNKRILEVNRLVVHPDFQKKNSIRVRFSIFKNVVEEVKRVGADCVVIGVRPEHVRFYKSIFSDVVTSSAKPYPLTKFKAVLLACFNLEEAGNLILKLSEK